MPPPPELPPSLQGSLPGCRWARGGGLVGRDGRRGQRGAGKQERLRGGASGREGQSGAAPGERQ